MNPNLTAYYWAEQTNRQRLVNQAARGWLIEEAAHHDRPTNVVIRVRHAAGALLVWMGTRLQEIGTANPLAVPGETAGPA
jgi:hypothetical protein